MQISKTTDRRNRKNHKGCKPGKAQTRRLSNMGKQGHGAKAKEKPKQKDMEGPEHRKAQFKRHWEYTGKLQMRAYIVRGGNGKEGH